MWTSIIRSVIYLAALAFMMWILAVILGMVVPIGSAGPYASDPAVVAVKGYFDALTLENLTVLAGLSAAVYLFGRAVVERKMAR